jgi:hypothetical protein
MRSISTSIAWRIASTETIAFAIAPVFSGR